MSLHKRSPEEVKTIIRALTDEGVVLVGGQCVNIWSLKYEEPGAEPWKSLKPFTSYDVDGFADNAQMLGIARRLEKEGYCVSVFFPKPDESGTPNTGKLIVTRRRFEVEIDLLHELKGVGPEEIRMQSQTLQWQNIHLRLLHPSLCVENKACNLLTLPQNNPREPRQDRKHLILSVANLRRHLLARTEDSSEEILLQTAERLIDFACHQHGLEIKRLQGIDLIEGIPWNEWPKSGKPRLIKLAGTRRSVDKTIEGRLGEIEELDAWIKALKATDSTARAHRASKTRRRKTS